MKLKKDKVAIYSRRGFALPSIIIASIVMISVLVITMSATTATRNALKEQKYTQLAQLAAEAGQNYAKACLALNNNVPTWTSIKPLKPNTDCTGTETVSCTDASTNGSCFVLIDGNIKTTFSVGYPVVDYAGKTTTIPASGSAKIIRTSTGTAWKTYNQSTSSTKSPTVFGTIVPYVSGCNVLNADSTYYYCVFKNAGSSTFSVRGDSIKADILVIAGGGGGGLPTDRSGGGGGAGGVQLFSNQTLLGPYTVIVGAGGAAGASGKRGNSGSNSQFGSLTASVGGGAGGVDGAGNIALTGGSGGGQGYKGTAVNIAGTAGQGNTGGQGINSGSGTIQYNGGGGGGAGATGANGTGTSAGGAGTSAYTSWGSATGIGQLISGTYWFGGGGGGVRQVGSATAAFTIGAGGNGGGSGTSGVAGLANTGGGGVGGGGTSVTPGVTPSAGGTGLVIVRYAKSQIYYNPDSMTFVNAIGGSVGDYAARTVQTADGGYAMTGFTTSFGSGSNDVFISRFDSGGNLLWSKIWGGTGDDSGWIIIQTNDGGFAVTGYTTSYGAGGQDAILLKYDSSGNLSWAKTWGGTGSDTGKQIVQNSDGSYTIAGTTDSYGAGGVDGFLAKFDSSGNLLWSKTWGGTGSDTLWFMTATSDGYAITGGTTSYGTATDVFLAKFNSAGTLSWSRTWGGTGSDFAYGLYQASDNGYAVSGVTASFGTANEAFLLKFDSTGALSWNKTWGGSGSDIGGTVVQSSDNGYVMGGNTASFGNGGGDVFLAKFDSAGTLSWNKTWGGSGYEGHYFTNKTSDDGFILGGTTNSYGAGNYDGAFLKFNSLGGITNCGSMCTTPTATVTAPTATVTTPTATVTTPTATVTSPPTTTSSITPIMTILSTP